MAIVPRRRKSGKMKYYATIYLGDGETDWSKPFDTEREAEREEKRMKRDLAAGTYRSNAGPGTKYGSFFAQWLKTRTTRGAKADAKLAKVHLLHREWLMNMTLEEIEDAGAPVAVRLVEELKTIRRKDNGKPVSQKYVSNLYGICTSSLRAARLRGLLKGNPWVLDKKTLRRTARRGTRKPYTLPEIHILTSGTVTEGVVFAALLFYLGGREGEICGRRFVDINADPELGLASMNVWSQYQDQPLKTDETDDPGEHARKVPIHPRLAAILDAWWRKDFELTYCRRPRRDDFIVPRRFKDGVSLNHTKGSGYKLWRAHLALKGVANRSLHSTRHTFISLARRPAGVDKLVVERITHNASGEVIDEYTHTVWEQLCHVVLGVDPIFPGDPAGEGAPAAPLLALPEHVDAVVDAPRPARGFVVETPGIEPGQGNGSTRKPSNADGTSVVDGEIVEDREDPPAGDGNCARQFLPTAADLALRRGPGRPRRTASRGHEPTRLTRRAVKAATDDLEVAARLDAAVTLALAGDQGNSDDNLRAMNGLLEAMHGPPEWAPDGTLVSGRLP